MNEIQCTKLELLNMLVTTKGTLKSSKGTVLVTKQTSSSKRKSIEKKKKSMKKQKVENRPKKEVSKKKAAEKGKYFHYNNNGHWKRNCPAYLMSLKNKKDGTPFKDMSDLLIIETNIMISFTSSWIIDSGSSTHLCTSAQDLEDSRR